MSVVDKPQVRGIEDRFEEDYQEISWSCIGAFLLGLFALTGFVSPLLWSIPLVAIVISLLALRKTRADSRLMGGSLAVIGLIISCFVLTSAPARHFSRQRALYQQARNHAENWLKLVQQHKEPEAFELQLYYHERQPRGAVLERHYAETPAMKMPGTDRDMDMESRMMATPDPYVRMKSFFQRPPLKSVFDHPEGRIEFVRNLRMERKMAVLRDKVYLLFHYHYQDSGADRTAALEVKLERDFYPELNESHWRVAEVAPP